MGGVDVFRPIDAAADESATVVVEYHHADAGAIGKVFEGHGRG
jgi:hypothetical protein